MLQQNIDYFPVNKKQGDIGEAIAARWFENEGWELAPYELKADKQNHIDRIAQHLFFGTCVYDVKHDYFVNSSGNIPFEDKKNKGKNAKEPWGTDENVKADYIIYTDGIQEDMEHPQIWIFRLRDLRAYYHKHPEGKRNTRGNCRLFPFEEYANEFGYWHVDNNWNETFIGVGKAWYIGQENTLENAS